MDHAVPDYAHGYADSFELTPAADADGVYVLEGDDVAADPWTAPVTHTRPFSAERLRPPPYGPAAPRRRPRRETSESEGFAAEPHATGGASGPQYASGPPRPLPARPHAFAANSGYRGYADGLPAMGERGLKSRRYDRAALVSSDWDERPEAYAPWGNAAWSELVPDPALRPPRGGVLPPAAGFPLLTSSAAAALTNTDFVEGFRGGGGSGCRCAFAGLGPLGLFLLIAVAVAVGVRLAAVLPELRLVARRVAGTAPAASPTTGKTAALPPV
jgi:hypothetical protein